MENTQNVSEKKVSKIDKFFGITKMGSTVRTEIVAGLVTFMTMIYIVLVNPTMFADLGYKFVDGVPVKTELNDLLYNGVFIATALSAAIGTVLIGLLAKLPLAQATGMGLNAYFVYTVCGFGMSNGLSYANALVFILIDGIVFLLLTVTGLRRQIFNAIPDCVKTAIPAGIGLFIAFIGLQNAGIVVKNDSTCVSMISLNLLGDATYSSVFPIMVTFAGLIAIAVLSHKNVKGAILWGILGSAVLYYALAALGLAWGDEACKSIFAGITFDNPFTAFKDFGEISFGKVFTEGFDFSGYLSNHSSAQLILTLVTGAFAFCLVDMFDTIGTLYGACARGNLLDEKGNVPNMDRAMLADAIATCTGAVLGTSTVTTFVESSSGIAEGGKTGLTSIVVAIGFIVVMFLSPIAKLVPTYATAPALIYVGVLMMNCVTKVDWLSPAKALPAFITIAMMAFTYNISFGIGLGLISYTLIQIFTGEFKKSDITTAIIGLVFGAMFFLTH
ncbi:MAG: NCS2 family permease [Candidatus Borkfalkiaceae bacterium]|nr:NCS2 family permease [Christensenellaceae bacterium]